MKPIPILSTSCFIFILSIDTFTPRLSSTSALPEEDEMERPPCFAILTPAPAATKDAHVDMLKVFSPSPPVPQVSTTSSSKSTGVRLSLNT